MNLKDALLNAGLQVSKDPVDRKEFDSVEDVDLPYCLDKKQTKEYFEKVTRKCINSWELYNAHMYVAISDSR